MRWHWSNTGNVGSGYLKYICDDCVDLYSDGMGQYRDLKMMLTEHVR